MQILAETEYQDLYRVTDGVLLVVNKFTPISYLPEINIQVHLYNAKQGKYHKGCQDGLKVLKSPCDYSYAGTTITIPKGTVTYHCVPVESTTNKPDWQYQIKTTGDLFSGDADLMENWLSDILYRIRQDECRR